MSSGYCEGYFALMEKHIICLILSQILGSPKFKEFAGDNLKFNKKFGSSPKGRKCSVLERHELQTRKNLGMFGKELKNSSLADRFTCLMSLSFQFHFGNQPLHISMHSQFLVPGL